MKRLMIAAALCVAALSGCATDGKVNSTPLPAATPATGVVGTVDTVVLSAKRAFALAELGYTVAADGVSVLVDAGLIHGATATKIRALNAEARVLLVQGKTASNLADMASAAARLFAIRDQLDAIKGDK